MPRRLFLVAFFLFSLHGLHAGVNSDIPVITVEGGDLSNAGHTRLSWQLSSETELVEVQQSVDPDFETFTTVYRGYDQATFISGLENGTYYFRARAGDGAWSEPVSLTVEHHSLQLAFVLFSIGALVFALTVFIVVRGALQSSDK